MSYFDDIPNPPVNDNAGVPASAGQRGRVPTKVKVVVGAAAVGLFFAAIVYGWPYTDRDPIDSGVTEATPVVPPAEEQEDVAGEPDVGGDSAVDDADDLAGGGGDDVLLGSSNDDLLGGDQATNDAIFAGTDQGPAGELPSLPDPVTPPPVAPLTAPGLGQLCSSVVHGSTESDIWMSGTVYGVDEAWIFVESPTVNGGVPVQIPVSDGAFSSPLPITQYGDHEVTRFELGSEAFAGPTDLMPTLVDGPGIVFPVGPDDGSIFDQECFEFTPEQLDELEETYDPGLGDPTASRVDPIDPATFVADFIDGFVADHRSGDVDHLQETLHPSIRLAFGDDICAEYVARTAGSIEAAAIVSTGAVQPLEMGTPNGLISFPEAIPFTVEFTLLDGSTVVNEARLPIHDGEAHWLTNCGVEMP